MYRCLNPGNIGVSLPWDECLDLARASGFEGVDVPVDTDTDPARVRDLLAEKGLRPGGHALPFDYADEAAWKTGMETLPEIARIAAEIGVTRFIRWIFPFSETLTRDENRRLHIDRLRPAAEVLADHGCRLGLEFIGPRTCRAGRPHSFVHDMHGMLDLAREIGENTGLLLDAWHWHTSLGTAEEIRELDAADIVYVHINDAPRGVPVELQEDLVRELPAATGVIDTGAFLESLRAVGYDGPVVPEPFDASLAELPDEEAIRRTGDALDHAWSTPPAPVPPETMPAIAVGKKKAWIVDEPTPTPRGAEVVVAIHAAPLCGSNMGAFASVEEHVNIGHEGAGEVVAVAQSNLLSVGDRVALAPLSACGRCETCRRGDTIFCEDRPSNPGFFSKYARVADVNCTVIPDDIDYVRASLTGCCLGPPYEALKRIGLRGFDTIVVTGLGPVGLGAVALATHLGARTVALDPVSFRRDLAERLGAETTLDPTAADIAEQVREAVGGGVRKAVDCSGRPEAQRLLVDLAAVRAVIAFVGENQDDLPLSPSRDFIRKGLTIAGCWHMNQQDAPDLFDFLRRGKEKADLLVSHTFGFDEAQKAFDTFASRESAKVILLPQK